MFSIMRWRVRKLERNSYDMTLTIIQHWHLPDFCSHLLKQNMTFYIVSGWKQSISFSWRTQLFLFWKFKLLFFLLQIVYTTVCLDDVPCEPSDFFPLSVHYQERFSAAGRTRYDMHSRFHFLYCMICFFVWVFNTSIYYFFSGGFFKREGKTKDHEVQLF